MTNKKDPDLPEPEQVTYCNLRAKAANPLLKQAADFREVEPSGEATGDLHDIVKGNEIGTLDA
jgi:hypothetical protein